MNIQRVFLIVSILVGVATLLLIVEGRLKKDGKSLCPCKNGASTTATTTPTTTETTTETV